MLSKEQRAAVLRRLAAGGARVLAVSWASRGGLVGPASDPPAAIATLELGGAGEPLRLVETPRAPSVRSARLLTELALFELCGDDWVIVELAPGVSARDVQERAEPTLLISPAVKEMSLE